MAKRRTPKNFKPTFFSFEDRLVPANFYVDNAFVGQPNGTIVTFNAGESNQVTGLTIGTNAFESFGDAITKANSDAAADTINFANGTFTVDQATNAGAFLITNPLDFVGSGKGVTTLKSITDTVDASGTNGALFAAQSTTFNVSNLTLDGDGGNGKLTASGFRYEAGALGTIVNTTLQNIQDLSSGDSAGYAVVVTGSGSNATIADSVIQNNGRGGVRFDDSANGTVSGNTITGRAGTGNDAINFGVEISNDSNALVTGNTINGFSGTDGAPVPDTVTSAGIQVVLSSTASIYGNTLDGNATGIIVGLGGADNSSIDAQYNNIVNNTFTGDLGSGVFIASTAKSTLLNNNWGNANGPLSPTDNPTGTNSSSVNTDNTGGANYKDSGITQPPNGIATGTLPVQVVTSPAEAASGASPTVVITGPGVPNNAPISLTVTFSEAVTGFSAGDVVLSGTAGTGTVTNVTTSDNKVFTVTVAGLNKRGTLAVNIASGAASSSANGVGSTAGAANIAFQPVFDRGFAAAGDSGIVTPVFGVAEDYSTRFGQTVFGSTYTGGERVATADVNGDGTLDYIIGSGPGISTQVRVFNGLTNTELTTNPSILNPFGTSFTRGAYVSAGDLTGDGLAEIVISAERGGGARVRIFSPNTVGVYTQLSDFIALRGSNDAPDVGFRGGSRTAVGDMNGDGRNDLIWAAGTGGGPRIALYNGLTLGANGGPKLTGDFFVYEPTLRNGSYVAAGDINADGKADLIAGAGNGASRLRAFSGAQLVSSNGSNTASFVDFFSFGSTGGGGVRVAAEDLDGDGKADVVAGNGPGGASSIRVYSSGNLLANGANPAITKQLDLFGAFTGGVFVG